MNLSDDQFPKPSVQACEDLNNAWHFFNSHMFGGELPPAMVILHRYAKAYGYFRPKTWAADGVDGVRDEIALNPDHLYRTDKETIGTLVHEQVHQWQEHFGKPSRKGYHNSQWADKMEEVGLMPSTTEQEGGKRTGQKVSHYVINGGLYQQLFDKLESQGFKIRWKNVNAGPGDKPEPKPKTRLKYSCGCDETVNIWAKPGVQAVCVTCEKPFVCEDE